jgi:hypothetical protein
MFNACGCQAMKTVELSEEFAESAVDFQPTVNNDQNYISGQLTVDGRNNRFGKKSFLPTEDGNIILRPEVANGKIAIGDENTKNILLGGEDTKIRMGKLDRVSASEFDTDVLKIGKKWRLSGVGDAHGNDDWLRFFDKNGGEYYGGIAVGKLWNGGATYLNGEFNAYGTANAHNGVNIKGGKSVYNPDNWGTHFPFSDGRNYIRGDTEVRGDVDLHGKISMNRSDPGEMIERQYGNNKGDRYGVGQFPNALAASHRSHKWEGSEDSSWSTQSVTKIKMVDIGSVKVDGFLHQAKTQNTRIKINILLWVSRDGRDVVNS